MKKTLLIMLLLVTSLTSFAQEEQTENPPLKNEISTNLLDLVIAGSLNINYERLFNKNQSLLIGTTLFDTYAYIDSGEIKENNAFSFKAAYLIYFSKRKDHAGFYFYPQLKVRTGTITTKSYYDSYSNYSEESYKYDVGGFSAGFGLGYKWLFYNKFSLNLFGEISRNLSSFDSNYLPNVEPRFGVQFGYRF